jgi:hypothetical protein
LGYERFGDVGVQLLPDIAPQAAASRILHQRVFEAIERIRRRASLEHQLGSRDHG